MLRYFVEKAGEDHSVFFKNLTIWEQGEKYTSQQGQYPVVNLTFKDVKEKTFDQCFKNIKNVISREYRRHSYILENKKIDQFDREQFLRIKNLEGEIVQYKNSLEFLTYLLKNHHQKNVIVLIDEYDTPVNEGYLAGYYEDIIHFMRGFLGGGLKGNSALKTAVITGIYRITYDDFFPGFNNLDVLSLITNRYTNFFGFTENEVEETLRYYDLTHKLEEIKEWYNGYIFGYDTVIYNPLSIISYIKNKELRTYWVDIENYDHFHRIILKNTETAQKKLQLLLEGQELKDVVIRSDTNFKDIKTLKVIGEERLWNLLLVSGYLKITGLHYTSDGDAVGDLRIPNKEILKMFQDVY